MSFHAHIFPVMVLAVTVLLSTCMLLGCQGSQETNMDHAQTIGSDVPESRTAKATFAGGCFWGVESAFRSVEGVVATRVGYTGGHVDNPTYRQVCSDTTGHAEAVEVTYDPSQVSYERLLEVFWKIHDPTQGHRQGPDVGSQYRSAIFVYDDRQREAAEASKAQLDQSGRYLGPITTEIVPAETFWQAEDYHQQYNEKNGLPSCHIF